MDPSMSKRTLESDNVVGVTSEFAVRLKTDRIRMSDEWLNRWCVVRRRKFWKKVSKQSPFRRNLHKSAEGLLTFTSATVCRLDEGV